MSAIRPIVTILLLAIVGVFLFLKMTAKEPDLPTDLAGWDVASELSMGADPAGGPPSLSIGGADPMGAPAPFQPTAPAEAPAYGDPGDPAPFVAAAPAFNAGPTAEAPGFAPSATQGSPAPAFSTQEPTAPAVVAPLVLDEAPTAPAYNAAPAAEPPAIEQSPAAPASRYGDVAEASPPPVAPVQPEAPPARTPTPPATSLFASTRIAAQSALDRGELSQALLLLSDWYGDPSLSPGEEKQLDTLLSQLAGSVIYSTEHRLEPPYRVQAGQRLQDIAQQYNVPWQLLAKINGLEDPNALSPGTELKVVRGPFEAVLDLSRRRLTLMLQRRYAGRFPLELEPETNVEDGLWTVDQKLLTPAGAGPAYGGVPSEERSLMLSNPVAAAGQVVILRGPGTPGAASADPPGRVVRLKTSDIEELFDIFSVGSRVVIRR